MEIIIWEVPAGNQFSCQSFAGGYQKYMSGELGGNHYSRHLGDTRGYFLSIITLSGMSRSGKTTFYENYLKDHTYIYLVEKMRQEVLRKDPSGCRGADRSLWWKVSTRLKKRYGNDVFHKDALERIKGHMLRGKRTFVIDGFRQVMEVPMFHDFLYRDGGIGDYAFWKDTMPETFPRTILWCHVHMCSGDKNVKDGLTDVSNESMEAIALKSLQVPTPNPVKVMLLKKGRYQGGRIKKVFSVQTPTGHIRIFKRRILDAYRHVVPVRGLYS